MDNEFHLSTIENFETSGGTDRSICNNFRKIKSETWIDIKKKNNLKL